MADEGGFDPCECVFSHEAGMRRLISLLRNSQSYCTDNECLQEMPQIGAQQSDMSGGFFLMMMMWLLVAAVLFLMRPSSLRRSRDGKPSNQGPDNSGNPPSAPIH